MKKLLIGIGIGVLFLGCASKEPKMATSVAEMMGDTKVVGWVEGNETKPKPKIKVVYKKIVKVKVKKVPVPVIKDSDKDGVVDKLDKCPNTPKGLLVNHEGCPIITTLRINFDFNKVEIKKIYYPELKKIALAMKANPKMKIEIDGYTDNIGNPKYNEELSLHRAKAVKRVLVEVFGADPKRIITKGFGEKYPLLPNTTPTNRTLNRRVEIVDITNKL